MVHILKLEGKGDFPLFFVKITRRQGLSEDGEIAELSTLNARIAILLTDLALYKELFKQKGTIPITIPMMPRLRTYALTRAEPATQKPKDCEAPRTHSHSFP